MRLTRIATAAAGVVTVAASALVVTAPAEAAQKTVISSFYHSNPIKSEQFQVRGTLSTRLARHVVLQLKSGTSWKNVVTDAKSDDTGAFAITTTTTKSSTYRVVAPVTTIDGKSRQRLQSPSKTVTVAAQTAKIAVVPSSLKAESGPVQVNLTFTPARPGRAVRIYWTYTDGQVDTIQDLVEDSHGKVTWSPGTPPSGAEGTYYFQGHADSAHGAAGVSTVKAKLTVK